MRRHKALLALILTAALLTAGCSSEEESAERTSTGEVSSQRAEKTEQGGSGSADSGAGGKVSARQGGKGSSRGSTKPGWTILVYLCGSDLETDYGMASVNIEEMCAADLTGDVHVLVETGGAREWYWEGVDPDLLERYEVEDGELTLVDQQDSASMGEVSTLTDFMDWGVSNYPSEHYGLILWDHGGGNADGVCYDELYDNDNLSMKELEEAMEAAPCAFDMIGFDACLMASLETAKAVDSAGSYMVASEETEPGYGWDYYTFLNALSQNPSMQGDELGRIICDSFLEKCEEYGVDEQATLSVLDLAEVERLDLAFDEYTGGMALAAEDVQTLNQVASGADKAESYGGNTDAEGYCNMVDIADLVNHTSPYLDNDGGTLLGVIGDAIVYETHGYGRADSNGISVFYPISISREELEYYADMSDNTPYLQYMAAVTDQYDAVDWDSQWEEYDSLYDLIGWLVSEDDADEDTGGAGDHTGEHGSNADGHPEESGTEEDNEAGDDEDGTGHWQEGQDNTDLSSLAQAIASLQESLVSLEPVTGDDFDITYEQYFDEGNQLTLEITSGLDAVKSVHFLLFYEPDGSESAEAAEYVYLGEDNNIDADYETGIFRDNFYGDWITIGGEYVSAELIEETDHYNLYSIPAVVNGKETNLRAIYNDAQQEYQVLGIYDGSYGNAAASITSRGIRPLEEGDEVVFLLPYYNQETDEEGSYLTDPVIWDTDVVMEDTELGDGFFLYMYEVEDIFGTEYDTDPVEMQVNGNVIQPYVYE